MDLWPRRFYVYLGSSRTPHNDIKTWVKRYAPPICALMADKLPDPAANALNQATFANLSRMLLDNQIVSPCARSYSGTFKVTHAVRKLAMSPWGLDTLPGAGMMIYPTSSSPSLLVGAIFLFGPFPDFATYQQQPARPNPQLGSSSHHQVQCFRSYFRGFFTTVSPLSIHMAATTAPVAMLHPKWRGYMFHQNSRGKPANNRLGNFLRGTMCLLLKKPPSLHAAADGLPSL